MEPGCIEWVDVGRRAFLVTLVDVSQKPVTADKDSIKFEMEAVESG